MKKTTPTRRLSAPGPLFTLTELTMFCDVEADRIVALVERGIVSPVETVGRDWVFAPPEVARARKALRLMADPGLNLNAVALVMDLIEERDALAHRLAMIETRLPA